MTIPNVVSITPASSRTSGRALVRIVGSGFRLPSAPPTTQGRAPAPPPSVRVLFGAVEAREVHVLSTQLLHVVTPVAAPGTVDVTVQNIDDAGVLVPGETTTKAAAFAFARPSFDGRDAAESLLARIVRALVTDLRRQLHDNVHLAVHTDYADAPTGEAAVAMLASVPGFALVGPRLRENRAESTNRRGVDVENGITVETRPGRTVDAVFTLIGVHELLQPTLNMLEETTLVFEDGAVLRVEDPADPTDPVEYEVIVEEPFALVSGSNNSNIRAFSGSFSVRAITLNREFMGTRALYDIDEVNPGGVVLDAGAVTLLGTPGASTVPPLPPAPTPGLGNAGPIEQILPEGDDS